MSELSELLRAAAARSGDVPSVASLRERVNRRRKNRRALVLSVSAVGLLAVSVIALVARERGESTVVMVPSATTDVPAPPRTTVPPPTTRPPTTTTSPASTTTSARPTTTAQSPLPTSPPTAPPSSQPGVPATRRIEIRIVGPYGVPFTKGHTIAQACPTDGGDCVFSTKVDGTGTEVIELDTATTYAIKAMAGNTGWPGGFSSGNQVFHFSNTIETTGARLADGTTFVVDGRPGAPEPTQLPDLATLLATDAAQRTCREASDAVERLAAVAGVTAAELADELDEIATGLADVERSAPVEMSGDLDWLVTMIDEFATQLRDLQEARAAASGDESTLVDSLVAAFPSYFRTVASREGMAGPAPILAACDLRSNGSGAADDMFVFGAAIDGLLASDLGQQPRFTGLQALADVTDHAERGRTPMSTFVDAFQDCHNDAAASQPGDNAGCDRLRQACEDGDMLACNDLYYSARVFGSAYELFGFFCGNRLVPEQQSNAVAGYCELM